MTAILRQHWQGVPSAEIGAKLERQRTAEEVDAAVEKEEPRWEATPLIVSSSVPNKAKSRLSNGWKSAASSTCHGSALSSRLPLGPASPDCRPGDDHVRTLQRQAVP
ncbi:MAG: hypothetical protein OXP66_00700 [Candidatus Tectomicrobia bacterium]|nr:hypothetical protein [Candidatus Tectomicrobia bacterium]